MLGSSLRRSRRYLLRAVLLAALSCSDAVAQQPQWRPSRVPDNNSAQPLNSFHQPTSQHAASPGHTLSAASSPSPQASEQLGSGVVLRWKTVAPTATANHMAATKLRPQTSVAISHSDAVATNGQHVAYNANPLRSQVMQAAYQQDNAEPIAPFGSGQFSPPALPQGDAGMPSLPGTNPAVQPSAQDFLPPAQLPSNSLQSDSLPSPNSDPLDSSETPPPPPTTGDVREPGSRDGSILEPQRPAFPVPEDRSPADRESDLELVPPPRGEEDKSRNDDSNELKRRNNNANSSSCDEIRRRIHANPLTTVDLDISPAYGKGFRNKQDPEQMRLDFAASAEVREWTDYRGFVVASGRMIDLRNERVVIDVNGLEQSIPMRDLSDVDVAYVGEAWNIPEKCGTGYEPFQGRNFVPATTRWAASGLCHKPLYFEQVQLERYGHEIGPILQPLVSSAHFFGSIPLLPYKMGIHPPNECQYPLGYYRPGSCAPYMMQPFPWSLRGAAVQAAAVTGAAALIP